MAVKHPNQLGAAVRARLRNVAHSSRKDLNVMSCWIVTLPPEMKGREKEFFQVAYDFTCDRYGTENVLQGIVHMDETTPHMHMPLVPVKDGRVSSKALFTARELSSYHKDLEKVMASEFGIKGLILNGRTKGNYTVQELKERSKMEKQQADRERALEARERAVKAKEDAARVKAAEMLRDASEVLQGASEALQGIQDVLEREKAAKAVKSVQTKAKAMRDRYRDLDTLTADIEANGRRNDGPEY